MNCVTFSAARTTGCAILAAAVLELSATFAHAGLAAYSLSEISLMPAVGARLPTEDRWHGENAIAVTLGEAIGNRPALIIFADFTCSTLCSPIVARTADALAQSGLRPGMDYRLLILGIDPKDGPAQALRMKQAQITDSGVASASIFLIGDDVAIRSAADAVGYRFTYDAEHDAFAHPAAVLAATADGRVSRVLSGLGLTPDDLRLALVEAGQGRIGDLGDRMRLLCYGFDPVAGVYTLSVHRLLAVTAGVVTLLLVVTIASLSMTPRRAS